MAHQLPHFACAPCSFAVIGHVVVPVVGHVAYNPSTLLAKNPFTGIAETSTTNYIIWRSMQYLKNRPQQNKTSSENLINL